MIENLTLKSNFNLEAVLRVSDGSKRGIVVAHSFRNDLNEVACREAADFFSKNGYNVLSFNFLGHGKSEGSLRSFSYRTAAENMDAAIVYLNDLGISDVGVYGISIGAMASVLSREKKIAQVLVSPTCIYDPKGLLQRYNQYLNEEELQRKGFVTAVSGSGRGNFEIGEEWIREMQRENGTIGSRHMVAKIPTLIIQGDKDETNNEKAYRSFKEGYGSRDFYLDVEGGDHNFNQEMQREIVLRKSLDWFEMF